jgi:hypothetical protein
MRCAVQWSKATSAKLLASATRPFKGGRDIGEQLAGGALQRIRSVEQAAHVGGQRAVLRVGCRVCHVVIMPLSSRADRERDREPERATAGSAS